MFGRLEKREERKSKTEKWSKKGGGLLFVIVDKEQVNLTNIYIFSYNFLNYFCL